MKKIKIDLKANGSGTIFLDDIDISNYVSHVTVDVHAHDVTQIIVKFAPADLELTAEGMITIKLEEPKTPAERDEFLQE
jgi:hypothetical protein